MRRFGFDFGHPSYNSIRTEISAVNRQRNISDNLPSKVQFGVCTRRKFRCLVVK